MVSTASQRPRKRVLIIEPQALFAPYFEAAVAASGLEVVGVEPAPPGTLTRRLQPDIVVLDAGYRGAPLGRIHALRLRFPDAHLVVYTPHADATWPLLARSLGADAVIGPQAGEPELVAALAA